MRRVGAFGGLIGHPADFDFGSKSMAGAAFSSNSKVRRKCYDENHVNSGVFENSHFKTIVNTYVMAFWESVVF